MNGVTQIASASQSRVFTLAEAEELFPLVRRITGEAQSELEPVRQRLEQIAGGTAAFGEAERRYEELVRRWVSKMERLGLVVQGLWLVDFDTGDGYLCWKYPELHLGHYHDYQDGFSGRRPLVEIIEEQDPDWAQPQ
ncbi:MAG: DUF2203 domain-containing protein [Gammaproteobacteria bacterium]|nr:DUF2203 domain-containing protein [Gammaproteobacteria bacterium]